MKTKILYWIRILIVILLVIPAGVLSMLADIVMGTITFISPYLTWNDLADLYRYFADVWEE